MEWLSQNWMWFALAIGAFILMSRGRMGCCGTRQTSAHGHNGPREAGSRDVRDGTAMAASDAPSKQAHNRHGGC
jgi:hypothetical protein